MMSLMIVCDVSVIVMQLLSNKLISQIISSHHIPYSNGGSESQLTGRIKIWYTIKLIMCMHACVWFCFCLLFYFRCIVILIFKFYLIKFYIFNLIVYIVNILCVSIHWFFFVFFMQSYLRVAMTIRVLMWLKLWLQRSMKMYVISCPNRIIN